jgi:hypothetical protein
MKSTKKLRSFRLKPETNHNVTNFRLQVRVKRTLVYTWVDTAILFYDKARAEDKVKKLNKRFSKLNKNK